MRTVAFVENIVFEYEGNVCSKAITVGDVDNDEDNELVLGTMHGDLYIFKGKNKKAWARASDLGTITCLQIGDVCNQGFNFLVVLTSEGYCHLFAIQFDQIPQDESDSQKEGKPIQLKAVHKQHLLANNKTLLIADINGDGKNELVIGYSDRQVSMYRWIPSTDISSVCPNLISGQFENVDTWHLAGQLGSLTVNKHPDGTMDLMVSQPGGTFVSLRSKNTNNPENHSCKDSHHSNHSGHGGQSATDPSPGKPDRFQGPWLIFHPLGSTRARNVNATTEVVASISRQKRGENLSTFSAICTQDGTLTLVDDDKILWSIFVDHQLFSLTKLDVTGDGREEVVACSWDGHTYIVNQNKEAVRFKFRENVAAFCAGHYAIQKNVNVPCLFYVTFNNQIVTYYRVNLSKIANTTLLEYMEQQEGLSELLQPFCDSSNTSRVRQLYRWCLYGFQPRPPDPTNIG